MKEGDLVEFVNVNTWGGRSPTGEIGIVMKRTYMSYEKSFTKWDVLFKDGIVNTQEKYLRSVK
jgi:hypothetical protein